MQPDKLKIALVFGGRSAEHKVSLRSSHPFLRPWTEINIMSYRCSSQWKGAGISDRKSCPHSTPEADLDEKDRIIVSPDPGHQGLLHLNGSGRIDPITVDVVFPVLHGTFGEDGTVQGLLELANLPYVGCGVMASAVGMDKIVMKAAFRDVGLAVGPFFWFLRSEWKQDPERVLKKLRFCRFPVFVKPANSGSSGLNQPRHWNARFQGRRGTCRIV